MNSRSTRQAVMLASSALATAAMMAIPAAAFAQDGAVQEVLVTASRIERAGFTAPTPTTVIGAETLQQRGITNISEALNEMPAFRPTQGPTASTLSAVSGQGAIADLRGLGARAVAPHAPRTLVMVDRRRHVPSAAGGTVDLNLIPTIMIDRADIVTGGASASWGSDAVAGVVNFITNRTLNGFKVDTSVGQTKYDDRREFRFGVMAGSKLSDRGHVTFGAEFVTQGKVAQPFYSRPWGKDEYGLITVPAGARPADQPSRFYAAQVRTCNEPEGGVILGVNADTNAANGADVLRGIRFGPDGSAQPYNYGQLYGVSSVGGCETNYDGFTGYLYSPSHRWSTLTNLNYTITDNIEMFAQVGIARSALRFYPPGRRDVDASGSGINATVIQRDNPYLPASVVATMTANNITSFYLGRGGDDLGIGGRPNATGVSQMNRATIGFNGGLPSDWKWEAYYSYGANKYDQTYRNAQLIQEYKYAVDAVRNPAGQIVCRVNLTAVTQPGCLPLNVLGAGRADPAAIAYTLGTNWRSDDYRQQVVSGSLNGELFSTWAGPISLAAGAEFRKETINSDADSASQRGQYKYGNNQPFRGSVTVKEVFGETVIPLLKDLPFAKSLDLSLAARRTDYSNSGGVTTWKAGLTYDINDMFRLRATRSRDIRAASLNELFGTSEQSVVATNPYTRVQFTARGTNGGNPSLTPEKADTWTAGVVFSPTWDWARGFRASVDYYDITIDDAITTYAGQTILDECRREIDNNLPKFFCNRLEFTGTGQAFAVSRVTSIPFNLVRQTAAGWDFEASYRMALLGGNLSVRGLATLNSDRSDFNLNGKLQNAGYLTGGSGGLPKLTGNLNVTYDINRLSATLQTRYLGEVRVNSTLIGPDQKGYSPTLANSVSDNINSAYAYFDLSAQYDIVDRGDGRKVQVYGVINNLANKEMPYTVQAQNGNSFIYDPLGRNYKLGVRLSF